MTVKEEICHSLDGEEAVGILFLTDSFHENGKIMMVVKLADLDFPGNFVGGSVFNLNGHVSSVVEAAEFGRRNFTLGDSISSGLLNARLFFGLVERRVFASRALTFLENAYKNKRERAWLAINKGDFQIMARTRRSIRLQICEIPEIKLSNGSKSII